MIRRIASLLKIQPPENNEGLLYASGTVVPTNATHGYQTGCIFTHTDGAAESALYVNEGSLTSCAFVPLLTTSSEAADLPDIGALAYGAGALLVADGDSYEEVAVGGQATLASTGALTIPLLGATAGTVAASKAVIVDAFKTVRFGGFNTSAAVTDAVSFATVPDTWTDGQLDILSVFGASAADLTSDKSAKCIRARHIVNVGTGNLAHETYGVMGQVVVKDTTLQHLHAGVIGTFEGHTSGVVVNGSYAYGACGVMARVGGGAAITATKDVCGVVAFLNGAAMDSGDCSAFAAGDSGAAGLWTNALAVERATNALALPAAGTAPVSTGGAVGTHGTSTVKIAITIGGVTHYLLASTVPTFA